MRNLRNKKPTHLFFAIGFVLLSILSKGQTPETAVEYMNYINSVQNPIQQDYMAYASAVARGKSARKVESKRNEIITSVSEAQKKIKALGPFKGDKSYRDTTVKFLDMAYKVMKEDYSKIVDMEEVAEQSYDAMEAYYLAQELASAKLDRAGVMVDTAFYAFARKNNVTIQKSEMSDLAKNVKKASAVMTYQRKIYLVFFKPYKQEAYLWDAVNKKNLSAIEQNKNSLITLSEEASKQLDTSKAYNNDRSLVAIAKEFQVFYKEECKNKIGLATDLIIKEENYAKAKKAFEAKASSDRKQTDVDAFNTSVNEYNKAVNNFNAANATLNSQRSALLEKWNKASQAFLDTHIPKNKK